MLASVARYGRGIVIPAGFPMRPLTFALASLLAAVAPVQASGRFDVDDACRVESRYAVSVDRGVWVFRDRAPEPTELRVDATQLRLDGRPVALSDADRGRLAALADAFNAAIPEAQALAVDALDIAFMAIIEVARGFDLKADTLATLERQRREVRVRLSASPAWMFAPEAAEALIEPLVESMVAELVPSVTGAAVRQAMAIAFTGDDERARAFERRMASMGDHIEAKVAQRAQGLERRAAALCDRLDRIDQIENGLEVRRPDGAPLDLITVRRGGVRTAAR